MTVGNVGGIKDQAFVDFISKPQTYNAASGQAMMGPMQQPAQDEFNYQEPKKKGGFGKTLFGLIVAAGAVIAGATIARKKGKLDIPEADADKFINKFIKKPADKLGAWTEKQIDAIKSLKIFGGKGKEAAADAAEEAAGDAGKAAGKEGEGAAEEAAS